MSYSQSTSATLRPQRSVIPFLFAITAEPDRRIELRDDVPMLISFRFSEDGNYLANAVFSIAFSPDGRRLISASGAREAIKLWDVGTRQELLTLGGTGSLLDAARWSADGDVILVGDPWQAWRAPSWEEIAAAEAKEKMAVQRP